MANPKIPAALGKSTVIFKNGNTNDIMKVIQMGESRFKNYGSDFCKWANHNFEATEESLRGLWEMVRTGIEYKVDPKGKQLIKTPPALAKIGVGDCKSKTLFINAVLRCLDIPYSIRFTSYSTFDSTPKHVYTIANLNGKKIIIDSVYSEFNRQALYKHKIDVPMAEISLIEGIPTGQELQTLNNVAYCNNYNLSPEQEAYLEAKANANKQIEVIRQKQAYVPKFENVAFNKLTDGQASLKLIERELKLIQVMKPELAPKMEKALNLIHKAIKGNYCITGDIDKELYRYAHQIQAAKNRIRPGNSFGIEQRRINYLSQRAGMKCIPKSAMIGSTAAFPSRQCMNSLWLERVPGTTSGFFPAPTGDQNGFCAGSSFFAPQGLFFTGNGTFTTNQSQINALKSRLYYRYGANTPYAVSFDDYEVAARTILQNLYNTGVIHQPEPDGSFWFNTQADYDLTIERLNQSSGVKSNWLNESFATNQAGTLGTGMFYSFANQIDPSISGFVAENNLPVQVQIKKSLQDNYLNSCVSFSGASFTNVQQLARQGFLFDSGGEQPEVKLAKLYNLTKSATVSGHAVGEPLSAVATVIIAVLSTILSSLPAIITAITNGAANANNLDPSLKASSQFQPPNGTQMPNAGDWPVEDPNGGGGGGSTSSLLPLGLLAGAAYLATKDD